MGEASMKPKTLFESCNSLPAVLKTMEVPKREMAMGQKPNRIPSEHPNPTTKIGSKMGGAPKAPKWDPIGLTHSQSLGRRPRKQEALSTLA